MADFAKLVELFDAHGVSFVSVTQQFNTTTSMGRLTLNVLLSFAQFEREVTSERIRDKVAASKRKGLWVGGMVPLGYELKDGKLLIVKEEAEQVRTIFKRYLELGSVNRLVVDLRDRKLRTKIRKLSTGATRGGVAFTQGPLFYILRNRFYIAEVRYKNEIFPGPQPPLLDRELFEAVQAKLTEQWSHRTATRNKSAALLSGLLFDDAGHPMIPTHATKNGVRYRYYVSQPYLRVLAKSSTSSVGRGPATDVEAAVTKALALHLGDRNRHTADQKQVDRSAMAANVARIEVRRNQLAVQLKSQHTDGASDIDHETERNLQASRGETFRTANPLVQAAVAKVSRDPAATVCLTSESPPHQGRATNGPAQGHRAWPKLAGRDRLGGITGCRADCCASQMQRPSCQYDDLTGLHCSGPHQGRD